MRNKEEYRFSPPKRVRGRPAHAMKEEEKKGRGRGGGGSVKEYDCLYKGGRLYFPNTFSFSQVIVILWISMVNNWKTSAKNSQYVQRKGRTVSDSYRAFTPCLANDELTGNRVVSFPQPAAQQQNGTTNTVSAEISWCVKAANPNNSLLKNSSQRSRRVYLAVLYSSVRSRQRLVHKKDLEPDLYEYLEPWT